MNKKGQCASIDLFFILSLNIKYHNVVVKKQFNNNVSLSKQKSSMSIFGWQFGNLASLSSLKSISIFIKNAKN